MECVRFRLPDHTAGRWDQGVLGRAVHSHVTHWVGVLSPTACNAGTTRGDWLGEAQAKSPPGKNSV